MQSTGSGAVGRPEYRAVMSRRADASWVNANARSDKRPIHAYRSATARRYSSTESEAEMRVQGQSTVHDQYQL